MKLSFFDTEKNEEDRCVFKPGHVSDPVCYVITQTSVEAQVKEQRALVQALRGTSF